MSSSQKFKVNGFQVFPEVVSRGRCELLLSSLPIDKSAGSRDLLKIEKIQEIAVWLRDSEQLGDFVGDLVAVQCTSFTKTRNNNWAVRLHRDQGIPATGGNGWKSCGTKHGLEFFRPPDEVLQSMIAVRLNLDGAPEGDIQVVPGSHLRKSRSERSKAIPVVVKQGGVLIMKPLLEHASSKLESSKSRRVLHFLFGPPMLPDGYTWLNSI